MTAQNLLNYQFLPSNQSATPVLLFIHGLFGDMNNLGVIARAFSDDYPVLRVDLRNHGGSFHCGEMNYQLMAQDLLTLLNHLQLKNVILIGHSMGGKTAMKLAEIAPHLVSRLIVIDIAPVSYQENRHTAVFEGLFAVKSEQAQTRRQAGIILEKFIGEQAVVQFMLKSFEPQSPQKFRFNVTALFNNYNVIMHWQPVRFAHPTLFIKGGNSDYIQPRHRADILTQFPQAASFVIANAGHWVHAEKPKSVIRAIRHFLDRNPEQR